MRTNIVIDDALMAEAMRVSGAASKREAVDLGLRALVRLRRQAGIKPYRGKLGWKGDLDAMRADSPA
jgi:Arc/MetJ family transcription regulator